MREGNTVGIEEWPIAKPLYDDDTDTIDCQRYSLPLYLLLDVVGKKSGLFSYSTNHWLRVGLPICRGGFLKNHQKIP